MSLIGTLEKIELARVLERIESYNKTGLLVVKSGGSWVELYFRAGRLMCIGPLRTQASLGERLLQEGIISAQALREAVQALGDGQRSETRMALTLMDMGYVSHEDLRAWASRKATEVLRALFAWSSGEMYFDDDVPPPPDRLLVALSITTLLAAIPTRPRSAQAQSGAATATTSSTSQERQGPAATKPSPDIAKFPTLMNASQFFQETRTHTPPASAPATEGLPPFDLSLRANLSTDKAVLLPDQPVRAVLPPQHVDISFMRPDMLMLPADLSAARDQEVQFQLTPDHWALLTRVDGRTTLGAALYELHIAPDALCTLAAQLQALGLIQLSLPGQVFPNTPGELSSAPQGPVYTEPTSNMMLPGNAATTASPWSAPLPPAENLSPFSSAVELSSPWGNQPAQPLPPNGPNPIHHDIYVQSR